jgi:single-strand DNA-binding protein
MANLNEVRLIGRLTRDPELRAIPSGQSIATFGLACNKKYTGTDGQAREDVLFVDVTAWGKQAELVSKYMKKGRLIYVGGRLKLENWDDKTTGQKRSKISVVAGNVQFLDWKEAEGEPAEAIRKEGGYGATGEYIQGEGQKDEPPF